jgi:hypothetical protein
MDPITTALVAAVAAGVASGAPKVAEQALRDGYNALKSLLVRKHGERNEVVQAIEKLESNPESKSRQGVLEEEVRSARLEEDPEITGAARRLMEALKSHPAARQHIVNVTAGGERSIAIGGSVSESNINSGDRST